MAFRPPYKNEDGTKATVEDLRRSRPWLFTDENSSLEEKIKIERTKWLTRKTKPFSSVTVNHEFRFADEKTFDKYGIPMIFVKVQDDSGKEFAVSRFGNVKYPKQTDLVYR